MITSTRLPNGKILFEQKPLGPTVYLDQWVWCRLSQDASFRARLIDAGTSNNACIMYSIASLVEIAQIENKDQMRALSEVMDALDFGFVEMDPVRVVALEKQHESEVIGIFNGRHPAADRDLLDYAVRRNYPAIPKMSTILDDLKCEIPARYAAMSERLSASWTPLIERARADSAVLARAKRKNKERVIVRKGPPHTDDILRMLNFFLVANETMKMNSNEWMDILHLVVPLAYMNFVLMDKRWINFVRNHLPLAPPDIATVYGPADIDSFLAALVHREACEPAL